MTTRTMLERIEAELIKRINSGDLTQQQLDQALQDLAAVQGALMGECT